MTFELPLHARRDDQVGDLRRQEAPRPLHSFDLSHLSGDTVFKLLIEPAKLASLRIQLHRLPLYDCIRPLKLIGSLAQFVEQASVRKTDYDLCRKILY